MSRTRRLTTMLAAATALIAILALPGAAAAKDRNHDRIPDCWEKRHHLSLSANQAKRDQDRDRLRNLAEFEAETNPRDADTDDDGVPDGQEHAGTIESFDSQTGMLTIDLFGKGTISGLVTEETEIECDGGGEAAASDSSGDGESSDDDGQGEEAGDDDGQENESGEDDGQGSNCTVADLTPGATVHEAELKVAGGSAVFEKVELAG